jgi:hypothetical protein
MIHLRGKTVADNVCLTTINDCIKPYSWFYVTEQSGLPSSAVSGILGLALNGRVQAGREPENDYSPTNEGFLKQLYLEGLLSEKMFATHLS